jgi:hypothetical protein
MSKWIAKLRSEKVTNLPGKKDDPNYAAIRGHIPKELQMKFKLWCLKNDVDNSEGMENLLKEYFEMKDREEEANQGKEDKS